MIELIESLSPEGASLIVVLIAFIVVLNVYLIKRNGFYVKVNCWFCNTWSKVLYTNRNSFNCSACLQYNGFTKEGDYNKVIEAQYNTSEVFFNKSIKTEPLSNGLCTYCNNNQRLKVQQLANFTPLYENNYNNEIEHFRNQLEKSYKLCRKCDHVLKRTLEHQNAWIFGNNLKNLRNKAVKKINDTLNRSKNATSARNLRYILLALTLVSVGHMLNIRVDFPKIEDVKRIVPKSFDPYVNLLNDYYMLSSNLEFENCLMGIVSSAGLFLQMLLVIADEGANIWMINESLGWMLLFVPVSVDFGKSYMLYIKFIQILGMMVLLYSYIRSKSSGARKVSSKTKYEFKKLQSHRESMDSSEEEEPCDTWSDTRTSGFYNFNSHHCQQYRASPPFQYRCVSNSFTTANSTSFLNDSYNLHSPSNINKDLSNSFDNLHLTYRSARPQLSASPVSVNSQKRPVLSPPKLKNITQNSWTAGGFWKNDINASSAAVECSQSSRSSSQTSGFVSNSPYQSLPSSRKASIGDMERTSSLCEPTYHNHSFPTTVHNKVGQQLFYRSDNTFYPIQSQNSMLVLNDTHPQYNLKSSFSNSCSPSLNPRGRPPVFVTEQRIPSRLFKNVSGFGGHEYSFRKPVF